MQTQEEEKTKQIKNKIKFFFLPCLKPAGINPDDLSPNIIPKLSVLSSFCSFSFVCSKKERNKSIVIMIITNK